VSLRRTVSGQTLIEQNFQSKITTIPQHQRLLKNPKSRGVLFSSHLTTRAAQDWSGAGPRSSPECAGMPPCSKRLFHLEIVRVLENVTALTSRQG